MLKSSERFSFINATAFWTFLSKSGINIFSKRIYFPSILARLENLARRFKYAKMYDEALGGIAGIQALPVNTKERKNAYWWYQILIDINALDCDAPVILKELQAAKIPCYGIQWPEAYEEVAYREHNGFGTAKFPFASNEYTDEASVQYDKAYSLRAQTVCLFLHPTWEEAHIQRCIDSFKAILAKHLK